MSNQINNRESALSQILRHNFNIQSINSTFFEDPIFMLEAISKGDGIIKYASDRLKNNRDFVAQAVKINGYSLEFVSTELKDDAAIVSLAIGETPFAFRYASDNLKNNIEITLKAIKRSSATFQYASKNIRGNREFLLKFISEHSILQYTTDEIKDDYEFVKLAMIKNKDNFQYASVRIGSNRELALIAVTDRPVLFCKLNEELRSDKEITLIAIKANLALKVHISASLKEEIGNSNPLKYLEAYMLAEKLEGLIQQKTTQNKKMKI